MTRCAYCATHGEGVRCDACGAPYDLRAPAPVWTLVCDPGVVLTPENRREVVAAAKAALQRGHTAYLVLPRGVSVQVT